MYVSGNVKIILSFFFQRELRTTQHRKHWASSAMTSCPTAVEASKSGPYTLTTKAIWRSLTSTTWAAAPYCSPRTTKFAPPLRWTGRSPGPWAVHGGPTTSRVPKCSSIWGHRTRQVLELQPGPIRCSHTYTEPVRSNWCSRTYMLKIIQAESNWSVWCW